MTITILYRWTGAVLYTGEAATLCDLVGTAVQSGADLRGASLRDADLRDADLGGADLRDANLRGAHLRDADLRDANLGGFRADLWEVLINAPAEIAALRAALVSGHVNGSTYSGECSCLVGTIAAARECAYTDMAGITPDSDRPAEQWFMNIKLGDTPETSQIVALTVEWIDEFTRLLEAACKVPA